MNRWEAYTKIIAAIPPAHRAGVVKTAIWVTGLGIIPAATLAAVKLLP